MSVERRLRILVISNLYPPAVAGGYEVECAGVVDHMRERHEVLVLTSTRGAGTAEEGVARVLPPVPPGSRLRSLRAPLDAVRAARATRRVMGAFGPELVYVWNGAQIPQAAIRVAETAGVPVAYRICEHWFGHLYRSDRFMRHLYGDDRGVRAVWAALARLVNRLPQLRLDPSRPVDAAVCWNAEAVRRLSPAPPSAHVVLERIVYPATSQGDEMVGLELRPAPVPTVACIGRVTPAKGTEVAYRAIAELRDRHDIEARLVVAGAGDEDFRRRLRELADELSITPLVDDRGQLARPAVKALLAEARVAVVPSVWEEPAPLVCVEAALARVPVVASRVGGIPELLQDPEHALLCPPGDAGAFADAFARTLSDPDETAARCERAFARAQELRYGPYLAHMDAFLDDAVAALGAAR
jgi:glycosyltransferase involved in cell wall biosynthesis